MFVLATNKKNIFNLSVLGVVFLCSLAALAVSETTTPTVSTTTTTLVSAQSAAVSNSTAVVSQGLAVAAGHVISSREVKISYVIDQALAMPLDKEIAEKSVEPQTAVKNKKKENVKISHASVKDQWLLANDSADLQAHLAQVLVEIVVSSEAENFSIGQVDKDELERWQKHLNEQTHNWSPWKALEVQADELNGILNRKMRAKNFLKFKMEASGVTVSEDEVKQYYEKNRVKFGNMPYAQFSQSIRDKLTQDQTQERLKDWFDILKRKYRVRLLSNQQSK